MILNILKIIGLILLCLIGLVLLLLLLILLVPVRYRAEVQYDKENLQVHVRATWLLVFCFYLEFLQKELSYRFKILCIPVFDSKRMTEPKNTKPTQKKNHEKKTVSENSVPPEPAEKSGEKKDTGEIDNIIKEPGNGQDDASGEESSPTETESEETSENGTEDPKQKRFVFHFMHPAELYGIIVNKFLDVCDIIKKKLSMARRNLDKICKMITADENRELVLFLFGELKKIFRHLRPTKHGIYVKEGFADPSLTGQVFGAYSVLNNILALNFVLEPDFDEEVLEVKAYAKGRIRVLNLLIIGIRVYFNKTLRKLIRRK